MIGIAGQLSEADIEALAAYLTQLQLTEQQEQQASAQLLGVVAH